MVYFSQWLPAGSQVILSFMLSLTILRAFSLNCIYWTLQWFPSDILWESMATSKTSTSWQSKWRNIGNAEFAAHYIVKVSLLFADGLHHTGHRWTAATPHSVAILLHPKHVYQLHKGPLSSFHGSGHTVNGLESISNGIWMPKWLFSFVINHTEFLECFTVVRYRWYYQWSQLAATEPIPWCNCLMYYKMRPPCHKTMNNASLF